MTSKVVSGQANLEYALTTMLLIAMVVISSVIGLGTGISSNLKLMQDTLPFGSTTINATGSPLQFSGVSNLWGGNKATPASLTNNPILSKLPIETAGNPAFISTSQMIMVAGANGTTDYLASTIAQRASLLLAQGSITQEQANQLYNLANSGHDLANAQARLEDAIANGQTTITTNGKTYTLTDYANQLGYKVNTSALQNWSLDPSIASSLLLPFAQQYALVKESSALQDPLVAQQINTLVMQVGALSDAISWTFCNSSTCQANVATLDTYKAATADHFQKDMLGAPAPLVTDIATIGPSAVTDQQSAAICQASSGADTGTQCSTH